MNYTPKGWKAPCYLVEGEGYHDDWSDFWDKTDWAYWESRTDRPLPELQDAQRFRA